MREGEIMGSKEMGWGELSNWREKASDLMFFDSGLYVIVKWNLVKNKDQRACLEFGRSKVFEIAVIG